METWKREEGGKREWEVSDTVSAHMEGFYNNLTNIMFVGKTDIHLYKKLLDLGDDNFPY